MFRVTLLLLAAVTAAPAFGWERVCQFTFDKTYDGVAVGKVKVFRERNEDGTWSYAVGMSGVAVDAAKVRCPKGEIATGYVSAKVTSGSNGFLDTGDLKVRGAKPDTIWKIFDKAFIRDCRNGARLWTSQTCEKMKE